MKISWKNIENWRSWKMRFFWDGHFEFFESAILNFFLLHFSEKRSPFIRGIIFFCTMDGFSRILEKKLSELLCTRLYFQRILVFHKYSWYDSGKVVCPYTLWKYRSINIRIKLQKKIHPIVEIKISSKILT